MNRAIEATAYHEAGHAVASWRLGIAIGRTGVTIVPDQTAGSLGSSASRQYVNRDIELDCSDRNRIRAERKVQVCLAGEVAQRRHDPRSVRRYHAKSDRRAAISLLTYFATERKELEAWFNLLHIRTENLLSNPDIWRAVERLAVALIERRTILGKDATEIIILGFGEQLYSRNPELRSQELAFAAKLKAAKGRRVHHNRGEASINPALSRDASISCRG
jgi:hypothetical protein